MDAGFGRQTVRASFARFRQDTRQSTETSVVRCQFRQTDQTVQYGLRMRGTDQIGYAALRAVYARMRNAMRIDRQSDNGYMRSSDIKQAKDGPGAKPDGPEHPAQSWCQFNSINLQTKSIIKSKQDLRLRFTVAVSPDGYGWISARFAAG